MLEKRKGLDFNKTSDGRKKVFIAVSVMCAVLVVGALSFLILFRYYDYDLSNIVRTTEQVTELSSDTAESQGPTLVGKTSFIYVHISDDKSEIRSIFFISADLQEGAIDILPVSPDETVTLNGKKASLIESFSSLGTQGILEGIVQNIGEKPDRYIIITDSGVINALKYLGDLQYTLDKKLSYKSDDLVLDLPEGEQLLSPDNVLRLIKYNCITEKEERSAKNAEIFKAAVNAYFSSEFAAQSQEYYTNLINCVQSDISAVDFAENKSVAELFALSEKTVCITESLSDDYSQTAVGSTEETE